MLSGHDQVSNVMNEMLKVMKSWEEGQGTQTDEWVELSLSEPHRHQETSILGSVTCQLITATSQTQSNFCHGTVEYKNTAAEICCDL